MTLAVHLKTKAHKKRVKNLRWAPHTQEEAERAAGMGNFIMPTERVVRDLTLGDQVRDDEYVKEEEEQQLKAIQKSIDDLDEVANKKQPSVFIAVKSSKSVTWMC